VEDRKIRKHLFERLHGRPDADWRPWRLLRFLQPGTGSSVFGLSDVGERVPRMRREELMKDNILPSDHLLKLRIKESVGWFVAGEGFWCALSLLSDRAFKLFAYLSLQVNRRTGRMTATHKELAAALGKSKRVVGTYVAELEAKEVCKVLSGKKPIHGYGLRNIGPRPAISSRIIIPGIDGDPGICRVGP
jgi:hypothetical protein